MFLFLIYFISPNIYHRCLTNKHRYLFFFWGLQSKPVFRNIISIVFPVVQMLMRMTGGRVHCMIAVHMTILQCDKNEFVSNTNDVAFSRKKPFSCEVYTLPPPPPHAPIQGASCQGGASNPLHFTATGLN